MGFLVCKWKLYILYDTFYKTDILLSMQTTCEFKYERSEAHSMTFKGKEKKG